MLQNYKNKSVFCRSDYCRTMQAIWYKTNYLIPTHYDITKDSQDYVGHWIKAVFCIQGYPDSDKQYMPVCL